MALKFLNKKGWHTGSLRNIENVWKAEQKHESEQRKLEELKKQIQEEKERDEFRQLQVQAGLTPVQDRLEFLYDSGLAVGKTSSEGFKELQSFPPTAAAQTASASASAAPSSSNSSAPGALFEDKPQSANDAWRKLHSDPLLMIRQREQEAMALIKNNPVKMAMIRKSVEAKKKDGDEAHGGQQKKAKSKHKRHSSKHQSDPENVSDGDKEMKQKAKHKGKHHLDSDEESIDRIRRHGHSHADHRSENRRHSNHVKEKSDRDESSLRRDVDEDLREKTHHCRHSRREYEIEKGHRSPVQKRSDRNYDRQRSWRDDENLRHEKYHSGSRNDKSVSRAIENGDSYQASDSKNAATAPKQDTHKRRGRVSELSAEERAARLREMQLDAEIHEEQRWKRLKKADEDDAREAIQAAHSRGKSFLDTVQKSVYGAEKGGSSTIEESVRRRSHFLQGRTEVDERNAFRR